MNKASVVIESVEWKRIILHLSGRLSGFGQGTLFFVESPDGGQSYGIPQARVEDGRFYIRINILGIAGEMPLPAGRWALCAKDSQKDAPAVYFEIDTSLVDLAADEASGQPRYSALFVKSRNHFYRALSQAGPDSGRYYIDITFKKPGSGPSLIQKIKKSVQKRADAFKRALYRAMFCLSGKVFRKNGRRVLFTTDSRSELSGNLKFVHDRMTERGLDKIFQFRYSLKQHLKSKRSLLDKLRLPYYLATSDIILMDDYHPVTYMFDYDPSVKIIQLWHACGAFKTLGLARSGKQGSSDFDTRNHKNYTYMTVSSDHAVAFHAEAFGIGEEKIIPTGIPRTDVFFDESYRANIKEQMYRAFPQAKKASKVILYAPTFRGNNAHSAYFPFDMLDIDRIGGYCLRTGSVFIVKMHPFIMEKLPIPEQYADCILDASEYREINDILFISDLLITDYSSVIYELSLLKKPMLFYAFDLDGYIESRDFFEPYEDIVPGKIVRTFDALMDALEAEDYDFYKLEGFVRKNFKYLDSGSTDRVIDRLILGNDGQEGQGR